jgi:hypothetical protein
MSSRIRQTRANIVLSAEQHDLNVVAEADARAADGVGAGEDEDGDGARAVVVVVARTEPSKPREASYVEWSGYLLSTGRCEHAQNEREEGDTNQTMFGVKPGRNGLELAGCATSHLELHLDRCCRGVRALAERAAADDVRLRRSVVREVVSRRICFTSSTSSNSATANSSSRLARSARRHA